MRYFEDAVTLRHDPAKCKGCRRCTEVCPHEVFAMQAKRAVMVDRGACMECGACATNCEHGAIEVRAGVGCAYGVLAGWKAGTEPSCGCSETSSGCC